MMSKARFIAVLGVLLVSAAPRFSSAQVKAAPPEPDQQIMDFSLAGYGEKGKKNWDIAGQSANIVTDKVKLKNVVTNLYGEGENITLTADKGDFNKTDGNVRLEENVLITTTSGAKMTTDSLNLDRKNQVVSTEDAVNIERENMIAQALGATGSPNLRKVNLEKNVQVQITPSSPEKSPLEGVKERITITCDGPLEIDYQKNIGTFKKNVKVETKEILMYSDTMEVYFIKSAQAATGRMAQPIGSMASGGKIDKIVAYGNVTIIRGDNVSRSEQATYSASDNKITLSGRPKLVIYPENDSAETLKH